MKDRNTVDPSKSSWKYRRRVVFLTLAFCAWCVAWIMFDGKDTRLNETIVWCAFGLAGSVIGFYVAGATWEDAKMATLKTTRNNKDQDET